MPGLEPASSFSPPGAPDTPTAPMTSSLALIGKAPCAAMIPVRCTAPVVGLSFTRWTNSPDGMRNVQTFRVWAEIRSVAGISYALAEAMDDGHCGLPTDELIPLAQKLLDVSPELV